MRRRLTALVAIVAMLVGCYHYVPASRSELSPGKRVRIDVTESRPLTIATDTGPAIYRNVGRITGEVVELRGDTLVLRRGSLVTASRPRGEWALRGNTRYVADTIDRLQARRFDGAATAWAIGVPIALIVYFLATLEFPAAVETSP